MRGDRPRARGNRDPGRRMSAKERRKGAAGELEVAKILQAHGFNARRTPNSGGLSWRGDIAGVPGYVIEVKRQERLAVPAWLDQAYAAARGGEIPVVVFRRSKAGTSPDGSWHAILPLEALAFLLKSAPASSQLPNPSRCIKCGEGWPRKGLSGAANMGEGWMHFPNCPAPASSEPSQGRSHVQGSEAA